MSFQIFTQRTNKKSNSYSSTNSALSTFATGIKLNKKLTKSSSCETLLNLNKDPKKIILPKIQKSAFEKEKQKVFSNIYNQDYLNSEIKNIKSNSKFSLDDFNLDEYQGNILKLFLPQVSYVAFEKLKLNLQKLKEKAMDESRRKSIAALKKKELGSIANLKLPMHIFEKLLYKRKIVI